MKVCLLEPTASVTGLSTYGAHNILEPLGLEYLASYLETQGHECVIVQQRCEPREKVFAGILGMSPDVLGISAQAYNIDDALWFARRAKTTLPKVKVVVGGYHPSALPNLAKHEYVDYVVIGEGELPFAQLLSCLESGQGVQEVTSIAYYDGHLQINSRAARIANLDALPFPKRNKTILEQCRMHGLMYPAPSKQTRVGMVTATRGCPYDCAFCCSQLIWAGQVSRRSPANVADELEVLASQHGVNAVFFCDLTFNANKSYAIRLCEEIARRDVPIHWYAMCNLRGMDGEIAGAMAVAKCVKIGFGIESFIEETRTTVKDRGGFDLKSANRILDEVSLSGTLIKCYFIIGFPWETRDTLEQLGADIAGLHADEIKVTFYVPFPGTRGYDMHRSMLKTSNWAKFTTLSEPVVRNENVRPEELKRIRRDMFGRFYNNSAWWDRVQWRIATSPHYADSFEEFADFLREHRILRCGVPSPLKRDTKGDVQEQAGRSLSPACPTQQGEYGLSSVRRWSLGSRD